MPEIIPVLELKGHIKLDNDQRHLLENISSATVDRLLKSERKNLKRRGSSRTSSTSLLKRSIKIKTFNCDDKGIPGYFEADLVSHCGGNGNGQFLNTLVIRDTFSQWTEFFPMVCKNSKEVIAALIEVQKILPYSIQGLDTDNGSEFINEALLNFCKNHSIEFTRSRAYNKNDQARVEEKNGSIIRKVVGYDRFEGIVSVKALDDLYKNLRLYINYFQPSLKLQSKERVGAKVHKSYDTPKTPYRRVIESAINKEIKTKMTQEYQSLDPVILLTEVKKLQEKFWQYAWEKQEKTNKEYNILVNGVNKDILLIKQKLKRQTKKKSRNTIIDSIDLKVYQSSRKPRKINSRKKDWFTDVFKDVWEPDVLPELENNNSIAASEIMKKLVIKHPKKFHMSQIRTMQRRVAKWRDNQRLIQQEGNSTMLMSMSIIFP